MVEDGSNGAWCGDLEGCCSTFIASSFCESAEQKAGKPKKCKDSWCSLLHLRF